MKNNRGWTLVELSIVMAILAILATIIIQQFGSLLKQARESAVKGHLGSIRSGLSVYFGDTEGVFPNDLSALTVNGKYLTELPRESIPDVAATGNPGHRNVLNTSQNYPDIPPNAGSFLQEGKALWGYVNSTASRNYGHVFVNCQHNDTKGSPWSFW